MDKFFAAVSLFRRRKYDECIEVCNELLQHNAALHQGPWELKMRSMTQRVYIDDIEADDDVAGESLSRALESLCVSSVATTQPTSDLHPLMQELQHATSTQHYLHFRIGNLFMRTPHLLLQTLVLS